MAGAIGLVILVMMNVLGGMGVASALLGAVVVTVVLGVLLSWILCRPADDVATIAKPAAPARPASGATPSRATTPGTTASARAEPAEATRTGGAVVGAALASGVMAAKDIGADAIDATKAAAAAVVEQVRHAGEAVAAGAVAVQHAASDAVGAAKDAAQDAVATVQHAAGDAADAAKDAAQVAAAKVRDVVSDSTSAATAAAPDAGHPKPTKRPAAGAAQKTSAASNVRAPAAKATPAGSDRVGLATPGVTLASFAALEDPVSDAAGAGHRPVGLSAPRGGQADDLKLIEGIGPVLEQRLHDWGIYHFDQIASWGPAEVAYADQNVPRFKGRASRDKWVAQARIIVTEGLAAFRERAKTNDY